MNNMDKKEIKSINDQKNYLTDLYNGIKNKINWQSNFVNSLKN